MKLEELRDLALLSRRFKKEYERYDLAFEVGQMVLERRLQIGVTQQELAKELGTKQSSIARLENGTDLPSLSFLNKAMRAMGVQIKITKL